MRLVNIAREGRYKSLTSGILEPLSIRNQRPQPDSYVRVVLSEPEFLADLATDDVMSFLLYEFSDFLAFQTESIEAAVSDFPIGQPFVFECGNEFRMVFLEDYLGGNQERFPVGNKVLYLFL